MDSGRIKVWFDPEADYLEVMFREEPGTFRETAIDEVMAKVDADGRVIGFSILGVSRLRGRPVELSLASTS